MPRKFLPGLSAVAKAAVQADVDVISSYPIRPYTGLMIELSEKVAQGELDAEFVHGEGEHAQLGIVHGASLSGARAMTGSSGVGVTYAMEVYSPISGDRCACQMVIADRTLDPPGDFGQEHTDALSTKDQGWILGWAASPQEAYDNTLLMYRVGEDRKVMLPQMNCQDGYFVSHIADWVELGEQSQVDEYLPPYNNPHPLDPLRPVQHGPQIYAEMGPALEATRYNAMWGSRDVIKQATEEFGKIFGRKRDPFLELYKMDDADIAIFIQGCHSITAKYAIDDARKKGVKVGLIRPRFIRPFPTPELEDVLGKVKVLGVVETNNSFGASGYAGQLTPEVCAAAVRAKSVPKLVSFFGGMGGHPIRISQFEYLIEKLAKGLKGDVEKPVHWLDLECEIEM
jgi:pyruvate ferredoxin oxidoreductase alpha subunit/oxalate oxidoreductase subunit alpha